MNTPAPSFPAVYAYCDPNPISYADLTAEQITAHIELQASIPTAAHFYDGEHVYVTGRQVTDPLDRNDEWQYRGEYWEMESVTPPAGMKIARAFPTNFRRVGDEELRQFVEENHHRIHQKTLVKIRRLLEDPGMG